MGCLRGRVLRDFRSRSCFCLHSYRSCDTCLIVKTSPFAECTVSDYTFLSQACSEQSKARTSIEFVPRFFFAGTRNGRKWWPGRRQAGLRPWRGHIYYRNATKIDKDERNFHCWAPNGAPKVCFAKKGAARDSSLRWLPKIFETISRRYTNYYSKFGLRSVSGERDHSKEPSKYLETLRANMEWKDNVQSRAEGKLCRKQTTWKERIKKGQTGKE